MTYEVLLISFNNYLTYPVVKMKLSLSKALSHIDFQGSLPHICILCYSLAFLRIESFCILVFMKFINVIIFNSTMSKFIGTYGHKQTFDFKLFSDFFLTIAILIVFHLR